MKNKNSENLLETGICEKTHSKQTIISIILKLKASIDEPITVIKRDGKLEESYFTDVYNESGCIFLYGSKLYGKSLLYYIENIDPSNSVSEKIEDFSKLVINIIDSLKVYIQSKKSYPLLRLSSIFYDKETGNVTILPEKLSKILNSYLPHDKQTLSNFCIPDPLKESIDTEQELAKSIIYLIYLFFLKISGNKIQRSIVYDVRTLIKGVPNSLAKTIWDVLKRKEDITLSKIRELLEKNKLLQLIENQHIPIFKRKGFINFTYKLSYTIFYKWKLIIVIAVIAGIFLYTISDVIYKSKLSNITEGKTPYEVVKLYIKSINDLDIEALNSLLYKRAGKDIIKEVSSVYVVKRMTEVYGLRWLRPDEVDLRNLPENVKVYGIENVKIIKTSDDKEPTFLIFYKKIFGEKGNLDIYNYQEQIKLKKVKNRWFIFNVTRKLLNHKEIK